MEIIDKEILENKPVKQALMAEHIFRKTIEQAIPCGIAEVDLEGRILPCAKMLKKPCERFR